MCKARSTNVTSVTKCCACHAKWLSWLILVTYETSFTMSGAAGLILQRHQILHLPRKMTLMSDVRHIWNVIYNARSNRCHPPTSPQCWGGSSRFDVNPCRPMPWWPSMKIGRRKMEVRIVAFKLISSSLRATVLKSLLSESPKKYVWRRHREPCIHPSLFSPRAMRNAARGTRLHKNMHIYIFFCSYTNKSTTCGVIRSYKVLWIRAFESSRCFWIIWLKFSINHDRLINIQHYSGSLALLKAWDVRTGVFWKKLKRK